MAHGFVVTYLHTHVRGNKTTAELPWDGWALDYERIVSLFTQGKADLSVAQAMGLSRGEADLISRLAARSSQVQ